MALRRPFIQTEPKTKLSAYAASSLCLANLVAPARLWAIPANRCRDRTQLPTLWRQTPRDRIVTDAARPPRHFPAELNSPLESLVHSLSAGPMNRIAQGLC